MRILAGYIAQSPEVLMRRPLPGREDRRDEILAFGNGYSHVRHTPGMPWEQLCQRLPSGWLPDVYLHWSPEYNPLFPGMDQASCLTVGVFGDWNLGGQALRHCAGDFDILVADHNGCELLRRAGFDRVIYSPLWAFDPNLHRRLPGLSRDIDVLMVGSFNHSVQWERSRWLARVAKLSRQHRVMVTSKVYGEEYVRLSNRAKIVFNRSIRGEINMRAYEAPACGALLFYERENPEIRGLFTDREECVLYGDNDLEALLAYYLAPENAAERERIAEAGWRKVQSHTNAHHLAGLLNKIEEEQGVAGGGEPSQMVPCSNVTASSSLFTSASSLRPPASFDREIRLASQWYHSADRSVYPELELRLIRLADACTEPAQRAEALSFRATLQSNCAYNMPPDAERNTLHESALRLYQEALTLAPEQVLPRRNLGFLHFCMGDAPAAEAELRRALARLESPALQPQQLRGVCFPRDWDPFDVAIERVWGEQTPETPEWRDALRPLFASQIHLMLAGSAYGRRELLPALFHSEKAVEGMPSNPENLAHLACALRARGRLEEASSAYRRTIETAPFRLEAWQQLGALYLDRMLPGEIIALMEEGLSLLEGCPVYAEYRSVFVQLRQQAREMSRQLEANPPAASLRLLAFPDWSASGDWQPLIREFVQSDPAATTLLMLRADPDRYADANVLLTKLENYLTRDLGLSADTLPDITLLNQPLPPEDHWKLYCIADAVLLGAPSTGFESELAAAVGCPVWQPEELRRNRPEARGQRPK